MSLTTLANSCRCLATGFINFGAVGRAEPREDNTCGRSRRRSSFALVSVSRAGNPSGSGGGGGGGGEGEARNRLYEPDGLEGLSRSQPSLDTSRARARAVVRYADLDPNAAKSLRPLAVTVRTLTAPLSNERAGGVSKNETISLTSRDFRPEPRKRSDDPRECDVRARKTDRTARRRNPNVEFYARGMRDLARISFLSRFVRSRGDRRREKFRSRLLEARSLFFFFYFSRKFLARTRSSIKKKKKSLSGTEKAGKAA